MKRDFQRKSKVLENGLFNLWLNVQMANYRKQSFDLFDIPFDDGLYIYLNVDMSCFDSNDIKECERLFNSRRARVCRLKKRIKNMLNKECLFITLTFRDDVLKSTSVETRRRYVARFLKSFNLPYVANIDFGAENNREHYHGVQQNDFIEINSWPYGYAFYKTIHVGDTTNVRIAKYMNKLSAHAYKDTTKGFNLLYSR